MILSLTVLKTSIFPTKLWRNLQKTLATYFLNCEKTWTTLDLSAPLKCVALSFLCTKICKPFHLKFASRENYTSKSSTRWGLYQIAYSDKIIMEGSMPSYETQDHQTRHTGHVRINSPTAWKWKLGYVHRDLILGLGKAHGTPVSFFKPRMCYPQASKDSWQGNTADFKVLIPKSYVLFSIFKYEQQNCCICIICHHMLTRGVKTTCEAIVK